MDGLGWSPTRRLNDVVWGLHALFTVITHLPVFHFDSLIVSLQDLLNFDDPLNIEASDMYRNSKEEFRMKVNEYVMLYAKD